MDLLVSEGEIDLDYVHRFLSTYRYFMDAHTLLAKLSQRYQARKRGRAGRAHADPGAGRARRERGDVDGLGPGPHEPCRDGAADPRG